MDKQLIISIGREFGSGGHVIAEELAKIFQIQLYDGNLIDEVFEKDVTAEDWRSSDEKPGTFAFSKVISGSKYSSEYMLAQHQFDVLKKKADEGESFVIVGRCSEHVLRGYEGLISIFVLGDEASKCERIQRIYNYSEKKAKAELVRQDGLRKRYHNSFCDIRWGDSRGYDLCVNSSRLGIEGTVKLLEYYIREKRGLDK